MTDRELMQQALEALIVAWQQNPHWQITEAMNTLRERLAREDKLPMVEIETVLTVQPEREWQGLTEEEIDACDPQEEIWGLHDVARAIEAKLRKKNA